MTTTTTFQGFWLLHDTNEKFLSNRKNDHNQGVSEPLGQVSTANSWERFTLAFSASGTQVQIKSNETGHYLQTNSANGVVAFGSTAVWLNCNDEGGGRFSLSPVGSQTWLCFGSSYYKLTSSADQRSIFTPIKQADASKLGDPYVGEAAIYSSENYGGTGWIFCQPYSDFTKISGLNDVAKSIKLGPQAGATLWQNQYSGHVADFATSQPKLSSAGFDESSASAIEVWQLSTPTHVLAEGEAVLYRSAIWTGPGRLIQQSQNTLHRYANGSLQVGPNTVVTLYSNAALSGTSQKIWGDITNFADGLGIGTTHQPLSLAIESAGEPTYTGSYTLQRASNANVRDQGIYLSIQMNQSIGSAKEIATEPWVSTWERLAMVPVGDGSQFRLYSEDRQLEVQAYGSLLLAMQSPAATAWTRFAEGDGTWSLQSGGQWISIVNGGFVMTSDRSQRERFIFLKVATSESQVGALAPGEVALYQLPNYRGNVFVFDCDNVVPSTDPTGTTGPMLTRSMRVGSHSGCWAYGDRARSAFIISSDTSRSSTSLSLGAINTWTLLATGDAPLSVDSVLMQDYSAPTGVLQTQKSYRVAITALNPAIDDRIEIGVADIDDTVRWNGTRIVAQAPQSYPINEMAQVALSMVAQDIRCSPLLVRVPSMAPNQYVLIFPDEQVHRMLSSVTGADIAAGDNPLITGHTAETAESTATAVRNLAEAIIGGYRDDGRRNVPAVPTSVRLTQGTSSAARSGMRTVRGCAIDNWGLSFSAGALPAYFVGTEGRTARSAASQVAPDGGQVFQSIGSQTWQQIWSTPGSIQSFVVTTPNDNTVPIRARSWIGNLWKKLVVTIEHVVEEAGQLVSKVTAFVLDTVRSVTTMMTSLFQAIGAAVDKVVDWLSALFDWDDILATRDALRNQLDSTLADLRTAMPVLEQRILDALDSAKGHMNAVLDQVAADLRQQPLRGVVAPFAGRANEADQSQVQSNWLLSTTLEQPQSISVVGVLEPTPATLVANIDTFFDSIKDAFQTPESEAAFAQARTIFQEALSAQSLTQALDDVLAAVITLVRGVADIAIDVAKLVVQGVFDLANAAFEVVNEWLTQEIVIPVVTPLYEQISGGAKLTLVELSLLMAAVPATIAYKLANDNQAPYSAAGGAIARTSGSTAWVQVGAVIQMFRGLVDLAVDACVISARKAGRQESKTAERVLSGTLLVLSATVIGCIRPGDTSVDPFLFWEQPRDYQQLSATAWNWQVLGTAVQVISLAQSKRLTRANFEYLGVFLDMGFGLTSFALACATFAKEANDPTSSLASGGYHFAESALESLPSIVKPLILVDNPYAYVAVGAVDLLAPLTASIMRLAES